MAGAVPFGKLALVFVKQASKPVANYIKREAKVHPVLSNALAWTGVRLHAFNINISRVVTGRPWLRLGSVIAMAPMSQEKAIEAGAELLGESVIFGIAGATVVFEVSRQQRSKQAESDRNKENERLQWEAFSTAAQEREALRQELAVIRNELQELKRRPRWW